MSATLSITEPSTGSLPPPARGREPILVLTLLTLATLAIGLVLALDARWGYDEAWHFYLSTLSPWTKALEEWLVDAHPPLHHLLLVPLADLGSEPFWFRLPSVLAATLSVPLWYLLLRRLRLDSDLALIGVVLFVTSLVFLDQGVSVRSYSLGILCLLAGLVAAITLVPRDATAATWTPRPLLAALALTLAFAFMYSALFVTLGLILAWMLTQPARALAILKAPVAWIKGWRFNQWAAALVLILGHLAILLWFLVGYGRGRGAVAPMHLESLVMADGQTLVAYLWSGLVGNAAWLTPQFPVTPPWPAIAVGAFWALVSIVLIRALWRRQTARLLLAWATLLVTLTVFAAGVAGLYPFGGLMRHQVMLWPLYLLMLLLAIDALWSLLRAPRARQTLAVLIVGFALLGLYRGEQAEAVGEGDTAAPWSDVLATIPCDPGQPIYLESYVLYPIHASLHPEGGGFRATYGFVDGVLTEVPYRKGWPGRAGSSRDWDVFASASGCTAERLIIRDRKQWGFPTIPETETLDRLRALMAELGVDSVRMLRLHPDGESAIDPAAVDAAYRAAGLTSTPLESIAGLDTWVVSVAP